LRIYAFLILLGVVDDSVLVFVVNLDSEEFLDALGRPHFDGIPCHPLAYVDADLATDAFIKADLHVGNHNIDAIRRVTWRMFDAVHRAETHAGLTPGAVVGNDNSDLFRFLLLTCDLPRCFRNDQRRISFFRIVRHL
jgi:hypothetical protein